LLHDRLPKQFRCCRPLHPTIGTRRGIEEP
jgi:hypothetical protein